MWGNNFKNIAKGNKVYWVILTDIFEKEGYTKTKINKRKVVISKVAKLYKFTDYHQLNFPTTKLDIIPNFELVKSINEIITKIKPDEVYLNFGNDIHTDHQVSYKVILSSIKSFRHQYIKMISLYETLSETHFQSPFLEKEFQPNYFIDISKFIEKKCNIMKIYKSELLKSPQPRTIENIKVLAKFRGSRCMSKFAEAFMTIYNVN